MMLLFLAMLGAAQVSAQTISGRISDRDNGQPLSGVLVKLMNSVMLVIDSITTDTSGGFKLVVGGHNKYALLFSHEGYDGNLFSNISIANDTSMDFRWKRKCPYITTTYTPECPLCHRKDQVIPIIYGLVKLKHGGKKDGLGEKFLLGGCEVSDCDPHWFCKRDKQVL